MASTLQDSVECKHQTTRCEQTKSFTLHVSVKCWRHALHTRTGNRSANTKQGNKLSTSVALYVSVDHWDKVWIQERETGTTTWRQGKKYMLRDESSKMHEHDYCPRVLNPRFMNHTDRTLPTKRSRSLIQDESLGGHCNATPNTQTHNLWVDQVNNNNATYWHLPLRCFCLALIFWT